MVIRIAARKSDLARLQAYQVGEKLKSLGLQPQYHFRQSLGDINQDDPLWKMPEKGVFTEDFREGLIQGQWDLVVHSWKDLPIEIDSKTELVATLPRADMRDLLLFKESSFEKVKQSRSIQVFSSSPRRIYNLTPFLKDYFPGGLDQVQFQNVRGNILTRAQKLLNDDKIDALVVAKAALDRLLAAQEDEFQEGKKALRDILGQCRFMVLPLKLNPTAAAQGALAIEISRERDDLKKKISQINCQITWNCVQQERRVLKSHGGGCHQKIGVSCLNRNWGEVQVLRGETESGEILNDLSQKNTQTIKLTKPSIESGVSFQRQEIQYQKPESGSAHFVAKSQAFPEAVELNENEVLWVSGLSTWKKMAQRGYWVHGCNESFGEREKPGLESLVSESLKWVKWSHRDGYQSPDKSFCATYQIRPTDVSSDYLQFQEFYWASGSQFKAAIRQYPELLSRKHFCGPGHSFTLISEVLKNNDISDPPTILATPELWKQLCKESQS